jgi:hypothetical protein
MKPGKILWVSMKRAVGRMLPVDEPKPPPDHQPSYVMRDGVPDLCCDQHPFYPKPAQD